MNKKNQIFLKNSFILSKKDIKNLLLQRNELLSSLQKFFRKNLGRFLFTKLFIFFFTKKNINKLYYKIIYKEFLLIKPFLKKEKRKKNILGIGCGLGGLEVILQKKIFNKSNFYLFERNFTSHKVVYGYDKSNKEAYNNIKATNLFIEKNSIDKNKFKLFNIDQDKLPSVKFDVVISILSLDYHYPFEVYYKYLKKNCSNSAIFIFDTIRPEYFKKIFKIVKIISIDNKKIHPSSRVYCKFFL